MYRTMLALAALAGSAAAYAAPPEIAFVKASSRGDSIHLVESDGSRLTKIYQGSAAGRFGPRIERIAMRMRAEDSNGGGEVAFLEGLFTLKVQKHDANGQPEGEAYEVSVDNGPECGFGDLDYLQNGTLIVSDSCGEVWAVAPGALAAGATALFQANVNSLTAIGDDILYVDGNDLERRSSAGSTTFLRSLANPFLFVDASSTHALFSEWMPSTFQTVELTSPYAIAAGCTQGGRVEISPDGTQMLYWYRNQMLLHASNCVGQTPTRVARGIRAFAWRSY